MPNLQTFEPFGLVIWFADARGRGVHWRDALRLGEWLEEAGLPVVLREGMPAIRIESPNDGGVVRPQRVAVETAVPYKTDIPEKLAEIANNTPTGFQLCIPGAPVPRPDPCPVSDSPHLA